MRSSVFQSAPATPTPPMHSPSTITGQPPSMAVQRSPPAASASPSAWLVSRSCPTAPLAEVGRLFEAAQTALVVAEWTVWKRPPSMRSSTIRCPPASVTAIDTAAPACCAVAIAAAIIVLAPVLVRRLLLAIFIKWPPRSKWKKICEADCGVIKVDSLSWRMFFVGEPVSTSPEHALPAVIERGREPTCLRDQRGVERRHRFARRHHQADRVHRLGLHDRDGADGRSQPERLGEPRRHDACPAAGSHMREQHDHRVRFKRRMRFATGRAEEAVNNAPVLH